MLSTLPKSRRHQTTIDARDQSIRDAAQKVLASNSHLRNSPIVCEFHEGTAVLRGRARRWYHKQIAQHVVLNVEGVGQVINHIEVDD